MTNLAGKKVAVLVDNFFEESEFTEPIEALKAAGAAVEVVAPHTGSLQSVRLSEPSTTYHVDRLLDDVRVDEYDALVLPGGSVNARAVCDNGMAQLWIRKFMSMGRPIAAICHSPWALAQAGVISGHVLTSFPAIQDDMREAGAEWIDEPVVVDDNLVTSRACRDLPAFDSALISLLGAGA